MQRGIGHNLGPPLDPPDPDESWRLWCWKRAHKRAWKTPPREIALRRLANAEKLGMSYRKYTLEIMERGRHISVAQAHEIAMRKQTDPELDGNILGVSRHRRFRP